MEYDAKYITSIDYADAKEIWDSTTRTFTGNLPRITMMLNVVDQTVYMDGTQRRDMLDSGYYGWIVTNTNDGAGTVADLSLPVTGYTNLLDYLSSHTDIPITIVIRDNHFHYYGTPAASYGLQWAPWNTNGKRLDGKHIGWEIDPSPPAEGLGVGVDATWNQPTGEPPPDEFSSYRLRYLTNDGLDVSDAEASITLPTYTDGNTAKPLLIPAHADSVDYWTKADQITYAYYTADKVAALAGVGITPSGFFIDAEDMPPNPWDNPDAATVLAKMKLDPRFNDLTEFDYYQHFWNGLRDIYSARVVQALTWFPNSSPAYSSIYGFIRHPYYFRMDWPTESVFWLNGRKLAVDNAYAFYSASTTFNKALSLYGYYLREFTCANVHVFVSWISAHVNQPSQIAGGLTISEMIMYTKLAMIMGGYKLWWYSFGRCLHSVWSVAVAYDEMQTYHEVITNGTNHVPPYSISRTYWLSNSGEATIFYDKDINGDTIDANTWICARVYNGTTLIFGGTSDGVTRTVTVLSPTGVAEEVTATAFGTINEC